MRPSPAPGDGVRLELRQNLPQFTLLVVVNAMVGAIAILTFASGVVAAVRMTETAPPATRVVRRPLSIAEENEHGTSD